MTEAPATSDGRRWHTCPVDAAAVDRLATELACPRAAAALLLARGIHTTEQARHFLYPTLAELHDPSLLLGMIAAVARIEQAVNAGEPILIYGDYDVDGTVATVLLKTAIERIAPSGRPATVGYHVPHRLREGYGMQSSRLAEASAAGVRLVISVDTGIRAFAAAAEAKALGLDLIVTDHHLPDGEQALPEALAVINPAQSGCPYPNKHLCGASVAFKLAHALLRAAAERAPDPAKSIDTLNQRLLPSFLKLLALATVADSVELTGENRAIVALGLRALANPVQPGLRALLRVAELPLDRPPTATEVGFRIAPRINAAGRMDVASDVVELFLTRDPERADILAEKLNSLNTDRRATEAAAIEAIELQLLTLVDAAGRYAPECLVLAHAEWHRGVIGILASRVVDRTGRPALVIALEDGHAHGSGRSIDGFHLLDALTAVHSAEPDTELFTRFGGHAHAVGFSLPGDRLTLLRERMRSHSAGRLSDELLTSPLACDIEVSPAELTDELCRWIARCAPFGMGNPEPVLLARGLTLAGPVRRIPSRGKPEKHICLPLIPAPGEPALRAMGWTRSGAARTWLERSASLAPGDTIDAVFRFNRNAHPQYGGLELDLIDLRPGQRP